MSAEGEETRKRNSHSRVLLYLRAGEDISRIRDVLAGMTVEGVVCTGLRDLRMQLPRNDIDALLLTESAATPSVLSRLAEALRNQPQWSDMPVLLVATGGPESPLGMQAMQAIPNLLVLDRPVRPAALGGVLQMARRSRDRQRQLRDLLDRLEHAAGRARPAEERRTEEELEKANERLRAQAGELAAAGERLSAEREKLRRQSLELDRLKDDAGRAAFRLEQLAGLVEENPDPALRVSAAGRIQYKNPASLDLIRRWNAQDPQSVPPAVQEIAAAALARTEIVRREMSFGRRAYLVTVLPAPGDCVDIFAHDITQCKQAEEARRRSERRFRNLFEASLVGVYLTRLDGTILDFNGAMMQMLGYDTREEVFQHRSTDFYADPEFRKELIRMLQRDGLFQARALTFRRKDGSLLYAIGHAVLLVNEQTGESYIQGMVVDITDLKQAQEELTRQRSFFDAVLRQMPVGVILAFDPQGRFMTANEAGREIFEVEAGENVSASAPEGERPAHRFFQAGRELRDYELPMQRAMAEGRTIPSMEIEMHAASGRRKWLRVSAAPVRDAKGAIIGSVGVGWDITDRKRAEQALRESEQRYFRLFEDDLTGDFVSTPEGRILLCNSAFAVTFGFPSPRDAIGTNIADLYFDPAEHRSLVERIRREGKIYRYEVWLKRRDGKAIYIVKNVVGHFDERGELFEILGYLFEDTEGKRAREALRESEDRLRFIVENSPDNIFIQDRNLRYVWVGRPAYPLTREEYLGRTDMDLGQAEEAAELTRIKRRVLEEGRRQTVELPLTLRDQRRVFEATYEPWRDAAGVIIGVAGYVRDITERKQSEEALRRSEETLEAFFAASPGILNIEDEEFRYLKTDSLTPTYFGLDRQSIVGKSLGDLAPEFIAEFGDMMRKVIETGRPELNTEVQSPARNRPNEARYWRASYFPVPLAGGKRGLGIVGVEITDMKKAEEALRDLNATLESRVAERTAELRRRARQLQKLTMEMSEAEDRERERIAYILHDDLQQDLAAAKFHLGLITSRMQNESSLREAVAKAEELLKDAIGKSRRLSHELSPAVLQEDDFAETLRWLAGEMRTSHDLTVHVHGRAPSRSRAIKTFLYRTARELFFNVVKHAAVREVSVRVRRYHGCLYLSVSDRGSGFDPTKLREATGFGLLSIRERIELLGGHMRIRSAPGRGSRFLVIVPARPGEKRGVS